MSTTSSESSLRIPRKKKLRLMCIDLTGDIDQMNEENPRNKYEFSDIKDSCQIEFNGKLIEINVKQLKVLNELGRGNFGEVNLVQLENDPNIQFACKKIQLEDHGRDNYSSDSDLKALKAVGNDRYPHIVHFYGALIDLQEKQIIICMEAVETSIDKFYPIVHLNLKPNSILLNSFLRRLAKHIVLALDYLKSKNIIHRDVKPHNMLVGHELIFKLCDFGICGTLKDSVSSTHLGSMRYLPPERIGNVCSYGTRSDMWALGMSLLEVGQGYQPLESESLISFMTQIKNGWQPNFPSTIENDVKQLISLLLRHDVEQRPRYYSDILSLESMDKVQQNPNQDEKDLVEKVLQILSLKTC